MEDRGGRTDLQRRQDVDKQRREVQVRWGNSVNRGRNWAGWSVLGDTAEKIPPGFEKSRGELDTVQGLFSPLRILHNRETSLRH